MWSARDEAIISAAQELGYLTPEQARDSKASFEAVSQAGMKVSLERLLLDKSYLSRTQLKRVFAELHSRGFHPTIGPYEILEKLGAGASATVYKALDKRTERIVALKVLSHAMAADGQTAERFVRGAMLAAKVEHPNIARIFESGQDGRDYFIAMEYVEGTLLSRKAAPDAPIPEREALEITKQIASALDACHELGIVHRDVKPSNIIVTVSGLAKLTDLGIAREVQGGSEDLTLTGHSIGTPHYMSPEQCASSKEVDGRSDIYSLGTTLFFMLTGQPPFSGDSVFEVMRQQSTSQLPNPRQFNRQISDMTHSLLWKMMAKTPEGRPQTAAELIAGIERVERMLADGSHVADEMQELLAEIAEPAEREKLGRSILRRVKAIDKRLEAVKKLSATWERYAAFAKEAREGAAFTAEDEKVFAALSGRISQEYLAVLPLLERPDRGRPVIRHCEQGLSLSATVQDRQSLDALEKGCEAGAKLLHDFQEFLEQSRRKTISESFLRYSLAKYLGTPRRQIGAGIGLALMICLSWFLIAQLYGKAANVAYEQSKAAEAPATRKPAPALTAAAPVAVKSRPALTATAPTRLVKSEQQRSVLALNGEQGGIRVKYNPIFDVRTAMTVEAWIRVEDPPSGIIVTRDNPKLGPWQFIFSDKGLLRADVAWGNWNLTPESSCRAIPTRKWIHVAMVYDGRVVRNYVNGKKVVSFPTCEKLSVNDNDIRIGYAPIWPVSTGRTFKGQIAEVRLSGAAIYDRDFTPQPRLTKAPTTLLLLPLDEGSGSVAKDASGHGNDGVITNGTWVTVSREEFQIGAPTQGSGPRAAAGDGKKYEKVIALDCGSNVKMTLALIPAGEFMMGGEESPEEIARKCVGGPPMAGTLGKLPEAFRSEQPRRLVKINTPFYMGIYCVTQAQYNAVMGAHSSSFDGPTRPVEMVSWYEAGQFCTRLSKNTGKNVRLPNEAEWEYACRAGTTTAFNTGATISTDQANYNGTGAYGTGKFGENRKMTTPVGTFAPNAWGLYDMHGNVWQWCSSLYKPYPYNPNDGREDETAPGDRVERGGSWCHSPFNARSAKRFGEPPTNRLHDIGFRVVMSADMADVASAQEEVPQTNDHGEPPAPATAVGEKALPADSPRRVLLDMSHNFTFAESNGLCDPNAYLERKAYVVMDTEAGLREDVLKEFDVVVLFQQSADAQYTQKDADLVKSLLERGGGVMLYADAGSCHGGLPLNRIAREFGVEFLPDAAQGPITGAPGYDGTISLHPRLLRIDAGVKYTPIARDKAGRPVIISMEWKKGRIVAVSGSDLLSNPANRGPRVNTATVRQLFQRLAATQVADESVDVLGLARTYPTRIDPDRVIEAGGFRFLCPDPLPEERINFLREKAATIYSAVSEQFGYETAEQKTIIGLMCAGSGWTASSTLMGIGLLGDEVGMASVLIHESSNSLCIEAPAWLGDAGWSAYVQIKVKTALGGRFAENVKGQLQRQVAEYHKWESAHGLYDLASGKDVYVGEGKVMEIISGFEKKYGPDIMKRYFAAARKWKDEPAVKSHPISDRVVFYFSLATGEDQYPYFKKLGTSVQRIDLPVKPEQDTSQRPEESVPAPGINP